MKHMKPFLESHFCDMVIDSICALTWWLIAFVMVIDSICLIVIVPDW